ncbi:hypothetical protein DSL72_001602 [Monilinia vaccinii-corymbosi]|uniref:Uncharacterized protein n=1 Tax=Monilinia vaccinii-corymbosi TaxID=61207 RepID=A0A8A3P2H0_9HELO|nr:hypothetical protein DSL72_001602 [Monilinia vaccinii-corymbosi]
MFSEIDNKLNILIGYYRTDVINTVIKQEMFYFG